MEQDLIKKVDISKIAAKGAKIYQRIKGKYEPDNYGKFLAIEVDSEGVIMGDTGAEVLEQGKIKFPGKVFYLVKVGFDSLETMARGILNGTFP